MNRDPTQLARVAPGSEMLATTMDALVAVLEQVEGLPDGTAPLALVEAAAHARAWWDHLINRECEAEREADRQIREYSQGDSTPAPPFDFERTGPGQR